MTALVAERFTQTDPMPMGAGTAYESSYVYGLNNPLVYVDPSGERGKSSLPSHPLPVPETPSCRSYEPHSIQDYLTGKRNEPCRFTAVFGYRPSNLGNGVHGYGGGSCSIPSPAGWSLIAEAAKRAFTPACKAHDYGYDLLRLARYGFDGAVGRFLFSDRTTTDAMLGRFMGDVCGRTGYFGWFNKARCQTNRGSLSESCAPGRLLSDRNSLGLRDWHGEVPTLTCSRPHLAWSGANLHIEPDFRTWPTWSADPSAACRVARGAHGAKTSSIEANVHRDRSSPMCGCTVHRHGHVRRRHRSRFDPPHIRMLLDSHACRCGRTCRASGYKPRFIIARRFTQTDPMPMGAGSAFESAYLYGSDNPVVVVDPSGFRSSLPPKAQYEGSSYFSVGGPALPLATVDLTAFCQATIGCMDSPFVGKVLAIPLGGTIFGDMIGTTFLKIYPKTFTVIQMIASHYFRVRSGRSVPTRHSHPRPFLHPVQAA